MKKQAGNLPDAVSTAKTLFDIVQCVKSSNGLTVTAVAAELDYAKSTVHRHLRTLEELGYVVEEPDGFHVGLRFLDIGQHARDCRPGFDLAHDMVDELAQETDERAQFLVEEHGEAVYLARSAGDRAVQTDPGVGSRIPLHATAAGKAILSALHEDRLFEIIEQTTFDPITDATVTNQETLLAELDKIRRRGYSFNRQENLDGLHAVGVPVQGTGDDVIGALSVSGPSHRLKGEWLEKELPDLLLGAANELELNIAHS
ncbi:IclR family transcriptional regulator [Haloquadratum walsbyi]|jgi:Transcriptional regulator|uniref:Transcriptional regulator n=1 Tax=Haloquadratum walsbyi J07HQW2 TaxID=1238425 RepID=U1NCK5_9EURY|nr:IclR family transcriptional regulator [Haloquadratum walsbyi]ERG94398.1 MAG: transcriptional regulator [Haloquadratum walsbyi J07HQW2]